MKKEFHTRSEAETLELGERLAPELKQGDVVALYGDLGSGKTHLIQGICKGLGVVTHVSSPTFTIVNEYHAVECPVYHFDFYRVKSAEEIRDIGFEEYVDGKGICLIEWAEKAAQFLPKRWLNIHLSLGEQEEMRTIVVTSHVKVGI